VLARLGRRIKDRRVSRPIINPVISAITVAAKRPSYYAGARESRFLLGRAPRRRTRRRHRRRHRRRQPANYRSASNERLIIGFHRLLPCFFNFLHRLRVRPMCKKDCPSINGWTRVGEAGFSGSLPLGAFFFFLLFVIFGL
jgi:hypothetical protein